MHIKRQINQFLEKKNNIYIDIIKNKTNGDYIHLNRQTVAKKKNISIRLERSSSIDWIFFKFLFKKIKNMSEA